MEYIQKQGHFNIYKCHLSRCRR